MSTPGISSTNTIPATAAAITSQTTLQKGLAIRIDLIRKAIIETEEVRSAPSEFQIAHIQRIRGRFHLPPPPKSLTQQDTLHNILSMLRQELHPFRQAPEEQFWTHDAVREDHLSHLPAEILQRIAQHTDRTTLRNLALTSHSLAQTIRRPLGENGHSLLEHFNNKEEILSILHGNSRLHIGSFKDISPELQRDEEIQRAYIHRRPEGIFELPLPSDEEYCIPEKNSQKRVIETIPHQKPEEATYRSQYNKLKKEAFLIATRDSRDLMIQHEPGIDKILPAFVEMICPPEASGDYRIRAIPRPDEIDYSKLARRFQNDPEIVTQSVEAFQQASPELKKNKSVVLQAVNNDGRSIQHVHETLKNDRTVVLAVVRNDSQAFERTSETFKNDREIVLAAVQRNPSSLQYASNTLKNDKEIVLTAVQRESNALQHASEALKKDPAFILKAIQINPRSLQYASETLKNDERIVLTAIQREGSALQHAGETLKNNPAFMLKAIQINPSCLQYVTITTFKKDEELFLKFVRNNVTNLRFASDALKNDPTFILKAIQINPRSLQYASETLKNDPAFILKAIQYYSDALAYASEAVKNNPAFILKAIQYYSDALAYASEAVKNNPAFILKAIQINPYSLHYASPDLKNNRAFILKAIRKDFTTLGFASEALRRDKKIVLEALRRSSDALLYADLELTNNRQFMLEAARINKKALDFIGNKLRQDPTFMAEVSK